jgi:tetratricopeptide (TPR) repeat protein
MTNLTDYEYDIFLSYSHADEEWTEKLAARLEREHWPAEGRRLRVFFAPWDIQPGQSIPERIEQALPRSRKVGLILSPEAVGSTWVKLERLVTTYIDMTEREERLLPLHLRACEKPPLLRPIRSIDFGVDSDFEESYQLLLSTIKGEPPPRGPKMEEDARAPVLSQIPRPPVIGFVARRDTDGRDIVERLKEKLAPRQNQLVTLSGPGGVGKSTLAAETARDLREAFGGRVVWSGAGGRADYTLSTLLDDISTQLGHEELRPLAPAAKEAQVRALVASPPTFVVLDNYETIKPDAQSLIEAWFAASSCSALFTSRQKIGETFNLPLAAMSREEAAEFLERVIGQTQDAQMFSEDVRRRIYETAEANPFIMQWVVGQIDAAEEPQTVLEELQQGEGDAAERVFDRSFNLPQLGDDGRAALLALSLFAPSASRPALAEVAGFGKDSERLNAALKNLRALWLIKALDANKRFTIEGLTRSLARARLSKDPRATEFRRRFVAYFLDYTEAHAQPTPEDFDALEGERENLLSAIDAASDSEDWRSVRELAAIVTSPVAGVLTIRGYWDDAIRCNEQATAAARKANNEGAIAHFSTNLATILLNRGEHDEARQAYQQALVTFKKLGEHKNVSAVIHQLAVIAQNQGEIEEARQLYNESLEIAKKLGDQNGIALTLHNLAVIAQSQGKIEEARQLYNESLEITKRLGDQSGIAISLHQLGRIAQEQGKIEEARQLYNESLEIKKRLGNQSGIASTLNNLGRLAEMEGNKDEAVKLIREALAIFEKLKSPHAEMARGNLKRLEGESS